MDGKGVGQLKRAATGRKLSRFIEECPRGSVRQDYAESFALLHLGAGEADLAICEVLILGRRVCVSIPKSTLIS